MDIDLGQMIHALSDALDFVGIDEVQHGKRVGYMLCEFGQVMGLDHHTQKELFYMGLLHDCGVSSTHVHKDLVDQMDWEGAHLHCEIGYERLRRFSPLASMAEIILHHHTHWEDLVKLNLPERTTRWSNLIFLADRVDTLVALYLNARLIEEKDRIRAKISELKNSFFSPEFVDIFLAASETEAFWITLEPRYLMRFIQQRETGREPLVMSLADVKKMAELFAQIVDAKSPYTAEHSAGVSRLASYLSDIHGLPNEISDKIKISGLLHDLGKLRVPDEVLDNPTKLKGQALAQMRHHSFDTYEILSRITGLEEIALWAANHHEALDGTGYPFRRKAGELSIESRIICVADIFQALGQNRPYREPLPPDKILAVLKDLAAQGHIDPELVNLVENNLDSCYREANCALP